MALLLLLLPVLCILDVRVDSEAFVRPNVILMLADDIGHNDLGFSANSESSTCTDTMSPYLDDLAESEGLRIIHSYAFKVCSPTRSSLMTGRYPSTIGLANEVFTPSFPVALSRQISTISEEFKANGYSTHYIGKWHLGMMSWEYTPNYRGFDSFHGFYGGYNYYYEHSMFTPCSEDSCASYYDLRIDEEPNWSPIEQQTYGTMLERDETVSLLNELKGNEDPFFLYLSWQAAHLPVEAPEEYLSKYSNASTSNRQITQAQISVLDDCVNDVVTTLKDNGMWDNTLLVFTSDNGPKYSYGDTFPLRGFKNSSFEGGIRVPTFVSGGYLAENRRGEQLDAVIMHVADWYPTLLSAVGFTVGYHQSTTLYQEIEADGRFTDNGVGTVPLDGKDLWGAIQYGEIDDEISYDSREVLLDLNSEGHCDYSPCGAIRIGRWKFVRGGNMGIEDENVELNGMLTEDGKVQWGRNFAICSESHWGCGEIPEDLSSSDFMCYGHESGCLFDLDEDPCEYHNLADIDDYVEIRDYMIGRLEYYASRSPEPLIQSADKEMNESVYSPKDGQFWSPYVEYEYAVFEDVLMEQYRVLYPSESVSKAEDSEETEVVEVASDEEEGDMESDVEFGDETAALGEEEAVIRGLKFKGRALSIICSVMVVVVFFVFILRNDIAFPAMLPEDGKVFNYASCDLYGASMRSP